MYDDDHGTRPTVYIQPMGIDGEKFRCTKQGDITTIYWAEQRLALAVTGRASNERLPAASRDWPLAYPSIDIRGAIGDTAHHILTILQGTVSFMRIRSFADAFDRRA
jgi:hypothetical protein